MFVLVHVPVISQRDNHPFKRFFFLILTYHYSSQFDVLKKAVKILMLKKKLFHFLFGYLNSSTLSSNCLIIQRGCFIAKYSNFCQFSFCCSCMERGEQVIRMKSNRVHLEVSFSIQVPSGCKGEHLDCLKAWLYYNRNLCVKKCNCVNKSWLVLPKVITRTQAYNIFVNCCLNALWKIYRQLSKQIQANET